MAHNKAKAVGAVAESAKESARMRAQRIDCSQNGATLRTRIVRDKTKYSRTLKHKNSLADAGDFPFRIMHRQVPTKINRKARALRPELSD